MDGRRWATRVTTSLLATTLILCVSAVGLDAQFEDDPPSASVDPWEGTYTSANLSITITFCDDHGLGQPTMTLNGNDVTSQFSYEDDPSSNCSGSARKISEGTVTLAEGSNEFTVRIRDSFFQLDADTTHYTLDSQSPSVSISPSGGDYQAADVDVTIDWCDGNSLNGSSRQVTLNGSDVTASFTYTSGSAGCGDSRTSEATITLDPGENTLTASIDDDVGHSGSSSTTYFLDSATPSISISPSGGSVNQSDLDVTIDWCDNQSLNASSREILLNGSDVTSSFTYSSGSTGCGDSKESEGTISLDPGQNTLEASIEDDLGNSGSSSVTYDLDTEPPSVDQTPHNGEYRDVARCVAGCFEASAGYATPAYVSRSQSRSLQLVYRSGQADPKGFLALDVRNPPGAPATPDKYSLRLQRPGGSWVTFENGNQEMFWDAGTGWQRLAVQFDAGGSTPEAQTDAYAYTAHVKSWFDGVSEVSTESVRVLVVNEEGSPYGAGWSIAGLQQLHFSSGGDIVLTEGDGSIAYFAQTSDTTWSSPDGDFTDLTKNASGDYVRHYPGGTTLTFNSTGRLISVAAGMGDTTTYSYNSGKLTTVTDPAGKQIDLGYGSDGKLAWIDGAGGRRTTITIDGSGDLTQIDDPAGGTALQATYDGNHRMQHRVDRRGGDWGFAYDFAGRLAADTMPTVTANGGSIRPVSEFGSVASQVLVDPASGLGTSSNPAGATASSSVEAWVEDAENERSYFRLHRLGPAVRIEQPLGRTTEFTRNADGQVTRVVGPRDDTTEYAWDGPDGRLSQLDDLVDNRTIQVDYDTLFTGAVSTKHVHGDIPDRWIFIWGDHQVDSVRVGSTGAPATEFQYDTQGRITRIVDPMGHEKEFFYANSGYMNRDSVADYKDRVTRFTYDNYGRLEAVTDPSGNTSRLEYDDLNRTVRRIDAQSDTVSYAYDELYLTSVTDPKGQQYDYARNALGWLTQRTDPRGASASFGYDALGRRTSWTTRTGTTVTYSYDELGHLESRTAGGETSTFSTDPDGRWRAASNSVSTDTVFFDRAGRVDRRVTVRNSNRYVLSSTYDSQGRRTALRIEEPASAADTVQYLYDGTWGQLDTLVDYSDGKTVRSFNADRQVVERAYPGGDTVFITYDSISHARQGYSFSRSVLNDSMSNSVLRDQRQRPVLQRTPANDSSDWREFQYDATGQLVEWSDVTWTPPDCDTSGCTPGSTDPIYTETYSYDAAGNRTDSNATIENGNRLTAFAGYNMTWDAAGRLTDKTGNGTDQNFYWSPTGRLDSVETDGQMVRYRYNAFGQRIEKDGPSGTTGYVWDGSSLVATTDGAGAVTAKFTYLPGIDRPHSMQRNGTTYYYGLDHLGGVWGLFEAGGPVANSYHYGPWGNVESSHESVENPLGYTGREWDAGPGLLYLRNRYYDPSIARFVSPDPIGLEGGINLYAYAGNSPVAFSDPFGLCHKQDHVTKECDGKVSTLFVIFSGPPKPPLRFYGGTTTGGVSAAGMAALGPGGPVVAGNNPVADDEADTQTNSPEGNECSAKAVLSEGGEVAAGFAATGAVVGGYIGYVGGNIPVVVSAGATGGVTLSLAPIAGPAGAIAGVNLGGIAGYKAGRVWGALVQLIDNCVSNK